MPIIEEMYAFIAEDTEAGNEGVMAIEGPLGMTPLVGADLPRIDSLRAQVQEIVTATGKTVRLVRFSVRAVVEVIRP